jgi:hypothetical protein
MAKAQKYSSHPRIPFSERPSCSVNEAVEASGLARSKVFDLIKTGRLASVKIDKRRMVIVPSLLELMRTGSRSGPAAA